MTNGPERVWPEVGVWRIRAGTGVVVGDGCLAIKPAGERSVLGTKNKTAKAIRPAAEKISKRNLVTGPII